MQTLMLGGILVAINLSPCTKYEKENLRESVFKLNLSSIVIEAQHKI